MRNQTIVTTYYCRFPVSIRESGSGQNLQPCWWRIEATAGFGHTPTASGAYLQNCSFHAGQESAWAAVNHEGEALARRRIYRDSGILGAWISLPSAAGGLGCGCGCVCWGELGGKGAPHSKTKRAGNFQQTIAKSKQIWGSSAFWPRPH